MWLLPPDVREPLLKGLRSAFPDLAKFDSFLRTKCSRERADIVSDNANLGYEDQIERVLRNAEYRFWSTILVENAIKEQPGNEDLKSAKELFDAHKAKGLVARFPIDASSILQRYPIPVLFCFIVALGLVAILLSSNCIWPFHNGMKANIVLNAKNDVIYVGEPVTLELKVHCRNGPAIKDDETEWIISSKTLGDKKETGNPIQVVAQDSETLSIVARSIKGSIEATKELRVKYAIQKQNQ